MSDDKGTICANVQLPPLSQDTAHLEQTSFDALLQNLGVLTKLALRQIKTVLYGQNT